MAEKTPLVVYQSRVCCRGEFTRRHGYAPDFGWVDIPTQFIGEIGELFKDIWQPWANMALQPLRAQPLSPNDLMDFSKAKIEHKTEVIGERETEVLIIKSNGFDKPVQNQTEVIDDKVLHRLGTLVFEGAPGDIGQPANGQYTPIEDKRDDQVFLRHIYVHPNGVQELLEDIKIPDHKHGETRVYLTDIRFFWQQYGATHLKANIRMAHGNFDPRSLNKGGKVYTTAALLQYAIESLPGTLPYLIEISEKDAAENIEWIWENPLRALVELIERYNLTMGLTRDNKIVISPDVKNHKKEHFFFGLDERQAPKARKSVELLGTSFSYRPHMVTVVGNPIVRNITEEAIAVALDLDGKVKPLSQIFLEWNYPASFAAEQMFLPDERRFSDFEQYFGIARGEQIFLVEARMKLARAWWGRAFQLLSCVGKDPAKSILPNMPMQERVIRAPHKGIYENLLERIIASTTTNPGLLSILQETAEAGNVKFLKQPFKYGVEFPEELKGELTARAPIRVMAHHLRHLYLTPEEAREYLIDAHNMILANIEILESKKEEIGIILDALITKTGHKLKFLSPQGQQLFRLAVEESKLKADNLSQLSWLEERGRRAAQLFTQFRITDYEQDAIEKLEEGRVKFMTDKTRDMLDKLDKQIAASYEILENWEFYIKTLKIERPFIQAWFNTYGEVPLGYYMSMDDVGLIFFSSPIGISRMPYAPSVESHSMGNYFDELSFGRVAITYAMWYETGNMSDHVYVNCIRVGEDVKVHSLNQRMFTHPYVLHNPNMTLYMDERQTPFNPRIVQDEALKLARPVLTQQEQTKAWHYVYAGFLPVDAIRHTTSVKWSYAPSANEESNLAPITEIEVMDYQNKDGISIVRRNTEVMGNLGIPKHKMRSAKSVESKKSAGRGGHH